MACRLCRFPFLLVDRVIEFEQGKYAVGYKNITINDEFFNGHFPGRPIMPGVCPLLYCSCLLYCSWRLSHRAPLRTQHKVCACTLHGGLTGARKPRARV